MEAYILETNTKSVAYEHDKRFLRNILKNEKFLTVPCSNRSIMRGEALCECIIEVSSDTERIVRAYLELLVGAIGQSLVSQLNEELFTAAPDELNVFDLRPSLRRTI